MPNGDGKGVDVAGQGDSPQNPFILSAVPIPG